MTNLLARITALAGAGTLVLLSAFGMAAATAWMGDGLFRTLVVVGANFALVGLPLGNAVGKLLCGLDAFDEREARDAT